MGKRLDITIFGTFHTVGALFLFKKSIVTGVKAYGPKKWHAMVRDIAVGVAPKKLVSEVGHTIGQPLAPIYLARGIALHGTDFGIEVFHGGEHVPISMVEAENRTLQPAMLMRQCESEDMLSVFWAKRTGSIFFRWDDVDELKPEDVVLAYDNLSPLLARKKPFELALNVTWQGKKGLRKEFGNDTALQSYKHVLHKAK